MLDGRSPALRHGPRGRHVLASSALGRRTRPALVSRGGACCTCRAKVMEGSVASGPRNFTLEPGRWNRLLCWSCQARPATSSASPSATTSADAQNPPPKLAGRGSTNRPANALAYALIFHHPGAVVRQLPGGALVARRGARLPGLWPLAGRGSLLRVYRARAWAPAPCCVCAVAALCGAGRPGHVDLRRLVWDRGAHHHRHQHCADLFRPPVLIAPFGAVAARALQPAVAAGAGVAIALAGVQHVIIKGHLECLGRRAVGARRPVGSWLSPPRLGRLCGTLAAVPAHACRAAPPLTQAPWRWRVAGAAALHRVELEAKPPSVGRFLA